MYLSWIWRLREEAVAVIDNIVFVVVQFSERPVTDGERQTVMQKNRLNTFSWNIPGIYHQIVVNLVLKSCLWSQKKKSKPRVQHKTVSL